LDQSRHPFLRNLFYLLLKVCTFVAVEKHNLISNIFTLSKTTTTNV
jgi:hypothetical protein